jgi:hypothetical protein
MIGCQSYGTLGIEKMDAFLTSVMRRKLILAVKMGETKGPDDTTQPDELKTILLLEQTRECKE